MPAGLLEQSEFLTTLFTDWPYRAPFLVLLACGLGLPLPEEVTLIGSGLLLYQGHVDFLPIVVVCSIAILIGDSVPFFLGRRFGLAALKIRWVGRILHPERFSRLEQRFREHGNWATFACRFVAGIRIPGYFVAGTMGMKYTRFVILDTLGVLISVPASIYLGMVFGSQVERLEETVGDLHLILAFLLVSVLMVIWVRGHGRSRLNKGQAAAPQAPSPPQEPPGGSPTPGRAEDSGAAAGSLGPGGAER